jgi:hypothetical protein
LVCRFAPSSSGPGESGPMDPPVFYIENPTCLCST